MDAAKRKLLEQTHKIVIDEGLKSENPDRVLKITSPNIIGLGTTFDEKIVGLKEVRTLLKRQQEQSKGLNISYESTNLGTRISKDENTAVIIDEIDLSITSDDQTINMIIRFSSVLEYSNNEWLLVHWHGSKPEEVESEKDTWGVETWKAKAEELEREVSQRTADLVLKNRDLAIQAALERVRAKSMAMQSSDELETIIQVVHDQFVDLGITLDHAGFIIDYKNNDDMVIWLADDHKVTPQIRLPYFDSPHWNSFITAKEKGHKLFVNHLDFKTKNEFYKQIFKYVPELPEDARNFYLKIPSLTIATALIDNIGLYIENFSGVQYQEEDQKILFRFGEEFQQAYTRFLDLQKAEAQTREAQIVASIERVRASTMAMHHSDELSAVLSTLFEQFDVLGIKPSHAVLTLINQEKNTLNFQMTGKYGHRVVAEKEVDLDVMDAWVDTKQKWKNSKPNAVNVNEYPPETLPDMWDLFAEIQAAIPKKAQPKIEDFPNGLYITEGYCKFGYIGFAHHRNPTNEEKDIVRRFATEFGALYQRFLDLKKTEAQAREAQVEAALERVRSRSLAMHSSVELNDVVSVLFENLKVLQIPITAAGISIYLEDSKDMLNYVCGENADGLVISHYRMPYFDNTISKDFQNVRKKETGFFVGNYSKKVKDAFYKYLFENTDIAEVPDDIKKMIFDSKAYTISMVHVSNSLIAINDFQGNQLSADHVSIIKRFAKVFEQAYIRFIDLQKAEAQAQEAQIEAGLERLRAQSMAMHSSDELKDVIRVIFDQMAQLKINAEHAGIVVEYEPKKDFHFWVADHQDIPAKITVPYLDLVWDKQFTEAKKKGQDFFTTQLDFEEKNSLYKQLLPNIENLTKESEDFYLNCAGLATSTVIQEDIALYIENFSGIPFTDEENSILKRFGKVFQQSYTRFLDLKKAEAQAREAQIEAALEKVRSRTMAMQKGEELKDVVVLLYKELISLGVTNFVTCGYVEINEQTEKQSTWITHPGGDSLGLFYLPLKGDATFDERYKAWKDQHHVFHQTVAGQQRKDHLDYAITTFNSKEAEVMVLSQFPDPTVFYCFNFSHGYLHIVAGSLLKKEEEALMARFTKVFEQTYARFLDLKKAELQAREAQINLAVERVRAKALAMHKSEEIMEVVDKLKDEVMGLDIPGVVAASIFLEAGNDNIRMWDLSSLEWSDKGYLAITDITFKLKKVDPHLYIKRVWENPDNYFVEVQNAKDLDRIIEFMYENNQLEVAKEVEDYTKSTNLQQLYHASKRLNNGKLCIDLLEPPPDEMEGILNKIGAAFDLAYQRFLDLQKAEAQTKESQIQLALERVRAKTMAMQHSDELREVVLEMYEQLQQLDFNSQACNITIIDQDTHDQQYWVSGFSQELYPESYHVPNLKHPYIQQQIKAWKKGIAYKVFEYKGAEKRKFDKIFFSETDFKKSPKEAQKLMRSLESVILSTAFTKFGSLQVLGPVPLNDERAEILQRFAKVFDQTYTRFLDLQKAEAQTREAHIEMALEKVRSRTMAMQKSEELRDAAQLLFTEIQNLGIPSWSCGYNILSDDKKSAECYMSSEGALQKPFTLYYKNEKSFLEQYHFFKSKKTFLVQEQKGKALEEAYDYMKTIPTIGEIIVDLEDSGISLPTHQFNHLCKFNKGYLLFITYEPVPEAHELFVRFTRVFEQTYTRFLDLQKAEAREKEAIKQASLDRVRGEIASMRTTKDLERITPLIWKELTTLGVPFFRCGVFIIREDEKMVHAYLSKPEGTSVAALHIPFSDTDNKLIKPTIENWRSQQVYKETWNQDQFIQQTHMIREKGQIENPDAYNISETPPEHLVLHLVPFKQGMVYVGNREDLTEEQIRLVKSLSTAFSVAYSRYEDFKALETAKNSLELTINNLKSTQAQLIQAEKMASLGELTAGIAHEIQNPLNFVNNFSEVSEELVDEMNEELDNGDVKEAKAISKDLKDNLSKINHHGKRADAIVKGMLEHSRINKGEKKPTDINALVDEFVRLSYHGLRAKDKSFNADFKLDLDPNLLKVNVVSSDIGRVILNLVNNAFYACAERSLISTDKHGKSEIKTYNPKVIISSKQTDHGIQLSVKDNGGGIPEQVRDKIFQPFFTTKPTGKGTGLGLSLSYDIIKAHGGQLTLESSEGDGTLFRIQIPIQ